MRSTSGYKKPNKADSSDTGSPVTPAAAATDGRRPPPARSPSPHRLARPAALRPAISEDELRQRRI